MSGFAVAGDRYDRQVVRRKFGRRKFGRATQDSRKAAPADFTHAIRCLAWESPKTGTGSCPSPALLDAAGPGATIRLVAGLTLLHVDHPQMPGFLLDVKESCSSSAMRRQTTPIMPGLGSYSSQPVHGQTPADRAVGTTSQK